MSAKKFYKIIQKIKKAWDKNLFWIVIFNRGILKMQIKEKKRMKNIITKAISVFITFVFILLTLSACSCTGTNSKKHPRGDGEYFSIELSRDSLELLKKTVVKNGRVVSIHYYTIAGYLGTGITYERRREVFHYDDDKLVSSETFDMLSDFEAIADNSSMMKKLYETVYIYQGDRIVRGDVYANGMPTRSYDEYEYAEDGTLKIAKRYENGELSCTYTYGENGLPKTFEKEDYIYNLSYNAKGNLTKIREENENKNAYSYDIKYKKDRPSEISYSVFVEPAFEMDPYTHRTVLKLEYNNKGYISYAYSEFNIGEGEANRWESTRLEYDKNGFAVSITGEGSYYKKHRYILTYNDLGILVCNEWLEESDGKLVSAGKSEAKGYTDDGKCLGFVNYFGREFSYKYDENGRLIEKSYDTNVNGYEHEVETYEYYPSGVLKLLTNACDGEVRKTLLYYESSNLKTETQYYGKARTETYEDSPYNYVFDRWDSVRQSTYKHYTEYFDPQDGSAGIRGSLDIPQN